MLGKAIGPGQKDWLRSVFGRCLLPAGCRSVSQAADRILQGVTAEELRDLDRDIQAMIRKQFIDRQPMGRLGTAEEIAMLAVYLASDEASYTTGQIHLADGGFAL